MKKILIAIVLLVAVLAPMFASNPDPLEVVTTISKKSEYAFTSEAYTDKSQPLSSITISGQQTVVPGSAGNIFYASIRTNTKGKAKAVLSYTNLINTADPNETIELKMFIDNVEKLSPVTAIEELNITSGLRALTKAFVLKFSQTDYDNASEGTYVATITMTISGI